MALPKDGIVNFIRRGDYTPGDEDIADLSTRWGTYIPFKDSLITYNAPSTRIIVDMHTKDVPGLTIYRWAAPISGMEESITIQGYINEDTIANSKLLAAKMVKARRYWQQNGLIILNWDYGSTLDYMIRNSSETVDAYKHYVDWSGFVLVQDSKKPGRFNYTMTFTFAEFIKREGI